MNDYISTMRKLIGHETLLTVSCGAILEDDQGRILLQQKYNRIWGIPGGLLEIGETFAETIHREVLEETNLIVKAMQLFGIYSGKNGFAQYANGDKVFSVQLIFMSPTTQAPSIPMKRVPDSLNPHQAPFILDWANGASTPIVK